MTAPIQHFIDIGDGQQREIRYTIALARRLAEQYTSFTAAMLKERIVILPDLIYHGLVDKTPFASADAVAEIIPMHRGDDLWESVAAAMAGLSVTDYRAKVKDAEEKAKAEAEAKNVKAQTVH